VRKGDKDEVANSIEINETSNSKKASTIINKPDAVVVNNISDKIRTDNAMLYPGAYNSVSALKSGVINEPTVSALNPNVTADGPVSIVEKLKLLLPKKQTLHLFNNRGLTVQAFVSPATAWNSLEDDHPHQSGVGGGPGGPVQDHREIEKHEKSSFAYSAGLKLSYGFSNRLSVQAGLNYSKMSTPENAKDIYAETDNNGHVRYRIDCSSGYTYLLPKGGSTPAAGDVKTVSDTRNTVSYLGIPLSLEYRLLNGRLSLSIAGGAQANVLLKGETKTVFDKGTDHESSVASKTEGLKASYFSGLTGIAADWRLTDRLSLTMMPSAQFAISTINRGTSVATKPNYLGVSAGLKLKL